MLLEGFPRIGPEELPGGEGWAIENVELTTHNGTHMDAPCTTSRWRRRQARDEHRRSAARLVLPPRRQARLPSLPDGHVVTAAEVETELKRIGHEVKPFDIVLVNTRAASCIGTDEYLTAGCGMGREATLYLTSRGVRVAGIDAWGWDAPFSHARAMGKTHDPEIIWEGHKAGREIPYCHMEKLCNLEQLPPTASRSPAFRTR